MRIEWQDRPDSRRGFRTGVRWFETDTSVRYEPVTPTGVALWRTARERWILEDPGACPPYRVLPPAEARAWLEGCGSPVALEAADRFFRRRRSDCGHVRWQGDRVLGMPEGLWAQTGAAARAARAPRAAWIRWTILGALRAHDESGLRLVGGPGEMVEWRRAGMSVEGVAARLSREEGRPVSGYRVRRLLAGSGWDRPVVRERVVRRHVVVPEAVWGRVVAAADGEGVSAPCWVRLAVERALRHNVDSDSTL